MPRTLDLPRGKMQWLDADRGICPVCSNYISLKKDGTLRRHNAVRSRRWKVCTGGGRPRP